MKKFFLMATLAVCAVLFVGCKQNEPSDPAAKVKAACVGDWKGTLIILGEESEEVTVTFTEERVTTTGNFTAKLSNWRAIDGQVWVDLDDEMKSAMNIAIDGVNMTIKGNSTAITMNFPEKLTKLLK